MPESSIFEVVEQFRIDGLDGDGSFDRAIEKLCQLTFTVPTFRRELQVQKYIWSKISRIDGVKLVKDRINMVNRERIEMLPKKQMAEIGELLNMVRRDRYDVKGKDRPFLALMREIVLTQIVEDESAEFDLENATQGLWCMSLLIQSLDTPVKDMIESHLGTESLNDFLNKFPHFRHGFNASNRSTRHKIEYIKEVVEPQLDLLAIGMKDATGDTVAWYDIAKNIHLKHFVDRYAAEKRISSVKSIKLILGRKILFSDDLNNTPSQLGIKDQDLISVSIRSPTLSQERAHLDLVTIGMKDTVDSTVSWYDIDKTVPLKNFADRYAAKKGITSAKDITLKHCGRTLSLGQLNKTPFDLGFKDQDMISVSIRPPTLSQERSPLKQLPIDNSISQPKRGKVKGNRKKSTIYVSPRDEEEKLRQKHSKAMSRVFEEAKQKFREIKKGLNDMNLERMPPKDRSRPSKPSPMMVQSHNNLPDADAPKAGKSYFVVRVGDANNLYKTAKPTTKTHRGNNVLIDLHGLTKDQALAKLDKSLPGWMNLAMKESYPFVIQVKIVCGGGSQSLAEVVENWIRVQRNVANAPKNQC